MKQGSGEDPFADLGEDESEAADSAVEPSGSDTEDGAAADSDSEATSSTKERYTDSSGSADERATSSTAASDVESTDDSDSDSTSAGSEQTKAEADGIPWVLRRSRVKEDRENVHQFFLREEYSTREDEILEAVAGELDMRQKDLQKLDVREAMVASAEPEAIADVLREWGYEYLK